jgi:hypothetical protein
MGGVVYAAAEGGAVMRELAYASTGMLDAGLHELLFACELTAAGGNQEKKPKFGSRSLL